MSVLVQSFDPSATPGGGSFNTNLGNAVGTLILYNLSPFELALQFPDGAQYVLPAWMARRFDVIYPCPNVAWTIKKSLGQTTPISLVWGEAYSSSEAERIAEVYPQQLPRVTNVGNVVTTVGATSTSIDEYLLTPFVLSGLSAASGGGNLLNVAGGVAFMQQPNNTITAVITPSTSFNTSTPSATYFLDLNPDGTFSWSTSHSPQANYLTICSVTTNGSGNILVVTDTRQLNTTLLAGSQGFVQANIGFLAATLQSTGNVVANGEVDVGNGNGFTAPARLFTINGTPEQAVLEAPQISGHAGAVVFESYDGAATHEPFGVGSGANGLTPAYVDDSGNLAANSVSKLAGMATAGALGVPAVVAVAHQVHVTSTGSQTILTFTPSASGLYRVSVWLRVNNGTSGNSVSLLANYTEAVTNTGVGVTFVASFNGMTGAATTLGGAASVANNFYVCFPLVIDASSSGSIQIVYHDPTNTPSDFVDAIIERLS